MHHEVLPFSLLASQFCLPWLAPCRAINVDYSETPMYPAMAREEPDMEEIVKLHIEKLPEGVYLATSDDIQGLVAQGRTVWETLEIARDVARRLREAQEERNEKPSTAPVGDSFDYDLIVER
jgi:predicted RNase H-like HicB family nuclease